MKGRLEKRSKSSWTIVIELGRDPATGKRKRLYRAVVGTKTQAKLEMERILAELKQGTYVQPAKTSLVQYLRDWVETYCKPNLAPSTIAGYTRAIEKHVVPELGHLMLHELQPMHLQTLYAKLLDKGLAPRMVQLVHVILHEALKHAVRWQMIPRNPADGVEPPRPRAAHVRTLTVPEVHRLLEGFKGHRDYAAVYLALHTGSRRGELLALKWDDVDLENGAIVIDEGLTAVDGEVAFSQPKTSRSRRTVPISRSVVEVLKQHRKRQLEDRLRAGPKWQENNLVFPDQFGRPQNPATFSSRFSYRVKQLGFAGLRFHDLRHTHASLLLQAGVNPKIVQERLGHESISTTMDIYSHVIPTLQQEAAQRFDDLVSGSDGGKMATIDRRQ